MCLPREQLSIFQKLNEDFFVMIKQTLLIIDRTFIHSFGASSRGDEVLIHLPQPYGSPPILAMLLKTANVDKVNYYFDVN